MSSVDLRFIRELHVFPYHRGGFLVLHPESFSLFKVGDLLAKLLKELANDDISTIALRNGIEEDELIAKLSAINEKVTHNLASVDTKIADDEDPRQREINITLHVSNACNLDCVYCYAQGGNYGRETRVRMDKALALKSIETMYRNFPLVESIMFFGGEPTLAMDIIELVCNYIKDKQVRGEIAKLPKYSMITNGTKLDDNAIRIIRENEIAITISVDGPKEINDRLRPHKGGQGSYDIIKAGFDRVVNETGMVPNVEATYTRVHHEAGMSMSSLVEFLHEEFKFSNGTVAHVDLPDGDPLTLKSTESADEIIDTLRTLMEGIAHGEHPKMERSMLQPILQFVTKTGTRFQCAVGYDGFDITTDGDIYPCQVFINQEDFLMGTVDDFDISNPSPRLKRAINRLSYRDKYTNPICRECWAKQFCFSCPGSEIFKSNDYQVPDWYCHRVRSGMEHMLTVLYDIKSDPTMWHNFLEGLKKLSKDMESQIPALALAQKPREKLYQIATAS